MRPKSQKVVRGTPRELKMTSWSSSVGVLGPSWGHLGGILGLSEGSKQKRDHTEGKRNCLLGPKGKAFAWQNVELDVSTVQWFVHEM